MREVVDDRGDFRSAQGPAADLGAYRFEALRAAPPA